MCHAGWNFGLGRDWAGFSASAPPKAVWGAFRGGVEMLSIDLITIGLDFFGKGIVKKNQLVKWSVVCTPKDQGGLGIHDLQVKNTALHGKWLFKLLTERWYLANNLETEIRRRKNVITSFSETR
jgi:hypothetical protein